VEVVLGGFASPDGRWRVLAVRERDRFWYRILLDGQIVADRLVIGLVVSALAELGAPDWAEFAEVR
jgi:hypothetical protein